MLEVLLLQLIISNVSKLFKFATAGLSEFGRKSINQFIFMRVLKIIGTKSYTKLLMLSFFFEKEKA